MGYRANKYDKILGKYLRLKRKENDITQLQIAKKFNISHPAFISMIEKGKSPYLIHGLSH